MDRPEKVAGPTLRTLGYQMYLVWTEIARLPSWDKAIEYVDSLRAEALAEWDTIQHEGIDAQGSAEYIATVAEQAVDTAVGALETEREIVRGLAAENDRDDRVLREYVNLRLAVDFHPEWSRILRRAGALSYSGNPSRPYHWHWSIKDLAGLKVYLDYSWETFAAMFFYRGQPARATMRNNPAAIWENDHPEILEKILTARTLQ